MAGFSGIPSTRGTGLDRRVGGVPLIIWLVGVPLVLVGGFMLYRQKTKGGQGGSLSPSGGQSTASPAVQSPVAIDPSSAFAQGITDQQGNLLPQFTWPYNQLALPYNYGPGIGVGPLGNSSYMYQSAQNPNFPGYQYTPTSGGV